MKSISGFPLQFYKRASEKMGMENVKAPVKPERDLLVLFFAL